jgi:hypothetical protein
MVLEKNGDLVLSVWDIVQKPHFSFCRHREQLHDERIRSGMGEDLINGDRLGKFLVNLSSDHSVRLLQRIMDETQRNLATLVRAGARMILVKDDSLPQEFVGLLWINAPKPAESQHERS